MRLNAQDVVHVLLSRLIVSGLVKRLSRRWSCGAAQQRLYEERPWTPSAGVRRQLDLRIVPCLDALRHGPFDINCQHAFYQAIRSIRSPKGRAAATPSSPEDAAQRARAPFGTPLARLIRLHRRCINAKKNERLQHTESNARRIMLIDATAKAHEDEHTARHQ
ncbi:hypothetical protein CBA19CS22_23010 [Caballeronia novacaledonica]|uniref:Uncharacterized protein n=1 Tax=Caballeronia novacaledonica TaxID=1544861 RepID=A0ACB5QWZ5_9BURK|nr:hypothetical protein CBA19CS22_23010 [Caballeronia novacaledonica]